jgi:hypothetical protein
MLDRDHHDRRRQHRARDIGEQRKQQRRRRQHRYGIDHHRNRAPSAEGAVGQARPDIDAAGDAAENSRKRIGNAETDQEPIVAGAELARLAGQLGAQQRIDRSNDRERQRPRQDHRQRALQRHRHRQPGKVDPYGPHRRARGQWTDHRTEHVAKAREKDGIVNNNAAAKADQDRRHFGRDAARVPHRCKSQAGDQHAQRPRLPDRSKDAGEANIMLKAQHVAELHQKQQHRGHVLEAGHHRMRREFDQGAQPQHAEQRLQQPAEQNDGEEHQ